MLGQAVDEMSVYQVQRTGHAGESSKCVFASACWTGELRQLRDVFLTRTLGKRFSGPRPSFILTSKAPMP